MSNEDKKPDIQDSSQDEHDVKSGNYKQAAIKTAYNIAESTMLIVGEAGKFIGNVSFAGAQKIKELSEKHCSKTCNEEDAQNACNKNKTNNP
jgi:hypothetical protein